MRNSLRTVAGALWFDLPLFLRCMATRDGWRMMRNRADIVRRAAGGGVRCEWRYTRSLHLANVFPVTGRWLLKRALRCAPVRFQDRPEHSTPTGTHWNGSVGDGEPEVSFLIGHRGRERRPLLEQALRSIAAQRDVRFECVVVEQEHDSSPRDPLPDWVRAVSTPAPPDLPYCRAWAFNVAAAVARAPVLIFHDNDLVVPDGYAGEALRRIRQGFEVVDLKRFIFYLTPAATEKLISRHRLAAQVEMALQNAGAGGSIALSRAAFDDLGGFDEDFVGWGGEDVEFWDRCLTRKVWAHATLPLLHLWHAAQPGKRATRGLGALTADLTERRRALSPETRIAELRRRPRGRADAPPMGGIPQ